MCFSTMSHIYILFLIHSLGSYFMFHTFFISMYIMYVVLCLLNALSHRVDALQISIIIIMHKMADWTS